MNTRKRLKKDFDRMEIPSRDAVIPHIHDSTHTPHKPQSAKKRWLSVPMAAVIAMILVIGVAAAGGIILSHLNANVLTQNSNRLTEVPQGYVGVYTTEDLMAINTALQDGTSATHYILMNDIVFTDADFAPGGICENGWNGIVTGRRDHLSVYDMTNTRYDDKTCLINGNGYVIKNLRIHADVTEALKPHLLTKNDGTVELLRTPHTTALLVGLFATQEPIHLQIINVGLENCEINIIGSDIELYNVNSSTPKKYQMLDVLIGGIAAGAEYIGGSYIDGLTVNIALNIPSSVNHRGESVPVEEAINYYDIAIGSIAGYAQYVDACYAENTTLRFQSDGAKLCEVSMGGIAGSSLSCLTSYFEGEITSDGTGVRTLYHDSICPAITESLIPKLLTQAAYENLKAKVYAKYGEDSFNSRKILAYYVCKDLSLDMTESAKQDLSVTMERWNRIMGKYANEGNLPIYDKLYVFDPSTSFGAESQLSDIIVSAFESEEEYIRFCAENNIKVGQMYCYTYKQGEQITEEQAVGFDFDTLWVIRDGRPRLQIFEN